MIDRLINGIIKTQNPTALGLDTRIEYLPDQGRSIDSFAAAGEAVYEFNRAMIDAAQGLIPVVKLQVAYYEMYGLPGMKAFGDTIDYAHKKGMLVIADCKRNDIGATAECYSAAYLGKTRLGNTEQAAYDADFLTVTPYLGFDGIQPFIKDCKTHDKGIFILVKTSNPSSGQLQDIVLSDGRTVYELIGDYVADWGKDNIGSHGYSDIGAVIGATYPEQGETMRKRLPHVFFLMPGYGAQGAAGKDLTGYFDSSGLGGIVNASRSLICAYRSKKYEGSGMTPEEAMHEEAKAMRKDITENLKLCGKWEL
ncbi:MAG TPA: orotidine-5'-phosphate decarboxylase [Clostridia bacterium]|nr:orotidine-5'-phosphate decarboxylase [Clostridia bacterium]